jgi:outer membrane receptor for ferrienterochelin and colicins
MLVHQIIAIRPKRAMSACVIAVLMLIGAWDFAQAQETPPVPSSPVQPVQAAPATGEKLDRIEVNAKRDVTAERRFSTAAKIVIGREEIEQFGDMTLADVMKRLPSVTVAGRPGRGGQIRMRGMGNGYTQILIDGDRIPRGFSIDQLSPDMVERIEIYRAPTAETGARAIAGTINIILREPLRQSGNDVRVGATEERGRVQPNLNWTRNDVIGESGTYNFTVSAARAIPRTDTSTETRYTDIATGLPSLAQSLRQIQHDERNSLHVSSRVQWDFGRGDQISLQPFVSITEGHTQIAGTLDQPFGFIPVPYADSESKGESRSSLARMVALFKKRLGDSTRMELRANVGTFKSNSNTVLDETDDSLATVLDQRSSTTINDRSWSLNAKLFHTVNDAHSLTAGVEAEGVNRDENALTFINGAPSLPGFGGDINASTLRLAAFAQDEWTISSAWAANAGLRWESIRTKSDAGFSQPVGGPFGGPIRNDSIVMTPLLHAVWRFDEPGRDQLRWSLTRSYRAPTLQNIIAVPTLSTLFPAPGPNTASSPDRAGNPGLHPELATGIDIALEHYFSGNGVVSISIFKRNIRDLIRNVVSLETVPWAVTQRWVSRPQNIGDATTHGVEFDAKFQLDELIAGAPPLTLRTNLSVYGSSVSGVPGPYNRIDQQPRATANFGGDYRFRSLPLTVGGNFSWVPPYTVQDAANQSQGYDLTRVIDTYALWTINKTTKLRLSLTNVVPRNYITSNTIVGGGQSQMVVANGPTYRVVGLRLEMKL